MRPKRPYLLRAIYDWIVDSGLTPYVLVQVDGADVVVPQDYVEDGRIVLNISPNAVRGLSMEGDALSFSGRFAGTPFNVVAPMRSVLAVYAKESGEGMMFDPEYEAVPVNSAQPSQGEGEGEGTRAQDDGTAGSGASSGAGSSDSRGAHLKVIK